MRMRKRKKQRGSGSDTGSRAGFLRRGMFEFEKLTVFGKAVDQLELVDQLVRRVPISHRHYRDQLSRAALSIVLNIAEGAGEYSTADKARFYRIARRSATECAGAIIAARRIGIIPPDRAGEALRGLHEVVSMLTGLTRTTEARAGTRRL